MTSTRTMFKATHNLLVFIAYCLS